MAKARQDLVDEALANLGIVQLAYIGTGTRQRAELVTEAMACLGVVQQSYAGATRTRAQIVTEAMACLGVVQKSPLVSAGTKTVVDLVNLALFNLGVLGEGQTASAESVASVTAAIDPVVRGLDARDVVSIANTNAIDNAYFLPLGSILAEAIKEQFGIQGDEAATLVADAKTAELDLKIITRSNLVDGKLDTIAASLASRAIAPVTVPVVTVPEQWFASVAMLVAESCKGFFEWLSPDLTTRVATEAQMAERRLRTVTGTALVDGKLDSLMAELQARAVVTIATPVVTVPTQYYPSLAAVLVNACKAKFEWLGADTLARVASEAQVAERTLKNLTRTFIVDRNVDPILSDLAARDIVYLVDITSIPDEWFMHLAAIIADRCKGKGFDLDPATLQRVSDEGTKALADLREQTRGRPSYNVQRTAYM